MKRRTSRSKGSSTPTEAETGYDQAIKKLQKMLDLAETDPDAFRIQCERIASKFGMRVEEVYQALQHDTEARREVKNFLVKNGVRFARRALGI